MDRLMTCRCSQDFSVPSRRLPRNVCGKVSCFVVLRGKLDRGRPPFRRARSLAKSPKFPQIWREIFLGPRDLRVRARKRPRLAEKQRCCRRVAAQHHIERGSRRRAGESSSSWARPSCAPGWRWRSGAPHCPATALRVCNISVEGSRVEDQNHPHMAACPLPPPAQERMRQ